MKTKLHKQLIWSWMKTVGEKKKERERKELRLKSWASKQHELRNNMSSTCSILHVRKHMIHKEGFLDGRNS